MSRNVLDLRPTRRAVLIDTTKLQQDELLGNSWERRIVELRHEPVVFGRSPSPRHTDVWLPGRLIARQLFEIRWNEEHNWHEVRVYPCIYAPSLNGEVLR